MIRNPSSTPSTQPQDQRIRQRHMSLVRMYVLMGGFLVGFFAVATKLLLIQVRDGKELSEQGRIQYESREIIPAVRGLILDRNLSILASNLTEYSITVDPMVIERPDTVARYLSQHLPGTRAGYLAKLAKTGKRYIVLEKGLSEDVASHFRTWKCFGLRLLPTPKRRYNFYALAGPVIGYTSNENAGQSGIELQMNRELAGQDGYIVYQRNAKGIRRPDVEFPRREPVNGRSVVLTIHQAYQSIAEEELAKGVEKYAAEAGRCIILQPRTGEVLAMANYPSIDPNNLADYSPEKARNRSVTDLYEPGSTFKLVAMSAALNEHLHKPSDVLDAERGIWTYSANQKPIVDDHPYARLTLREAFEHSSNIISAKLADRLGAERFYKYARNFGFGVQTGIELPGELRGELKKPIDWDPIILKYMAFGYGLSVTSIQIAAAYAAIANDGLLMRPFIRRWLLDEQRHIVDETVPQVIRRVVSSETAATMRSFMQGVVDSGTARLARIEGMSIGGKTGTSQRLVNKAYSDKSHVASFVGYFPVEDPRILILVILDSPKNGYYGGLVAAPIFREIALRIINSTPEFAKQPSPQLSEHQGEALVPNVVGLPVDMAQTLLKSHGLGLRARNSGELIDTQTPSASVRAPLRASVDVNFAKKGGRHTADSLRVPNVVGLSVRHAMLVMTQRGLLPGATGSGIVEAQAPAAGTPAAAGMRCTLICEPRRIHTARVY
jgi:cell division protein FtsI (penicillin-binding protein 3)